MQSITPPDVADPVGFDDLRDISLEELQALPREPARVKWFDRGKGFGFANTFGRLEDVFIHIEVLRHCGYTDLKPAEAIGLRVIDRPHGRIAVEVVPWEYSGSEREDRD